MFSVNMCVQVSLNQVSTKDWYSWSYANFYTFTPWRIVCIELQIRLFNLEHRQDFTLVPFPIPSRYYFHLFLKANRTWTTPIENYLLNTLPWLLTGLFVFCVQCLSSLYIIQTHILLDKWVEKIFFLFCGLYLHYADHPFIVENTFWLYHPLSFFCYCVASRFSCSFYNEHLFSQQFVECLSDTRY